MHASSREQLGKWILRVALGLLILLHGIAKLQGGYKAVGGMLLKAGMPASLSYLVFIGEILAPLLLILGLWTRAAAFLIVINMIVAIFLVHTGELFSLTKNGGWAIELQAMYLFSALAVALLGAGRYSVGGERGRWN